jgi:hypothetical protein
MGLRFGQLIAVMFLASCTTSRWIIQDEPANDLTQVRLVETAPILSLKRMPTPESPVLVFSFQDRIVSEFPRRVEQRRFLQAYRPRYGFMLFGLGLSAGLVYIANSSVVSGEIASGQRNGINAAAAALATASVFNLKPDGDPIYTGEARLMNTIGVGTRVDTLDRPGSASILESRISAVYDGVTILDDLLKPGINQEVAIDLVTELPFRAYSTTDPGMVDLLIRTRSGSFSQQVPVESFLKRYARINRRNTPIRSTPIVSSANVVTTVAEASLLPWISTEDGWHEVRLGLTTVYVKADDAPLVWMPASGASGLVVSTDLRFGEIDVERNVPTRAAIQPDAAAVIIANQSYANDSYGNRFALRSAELMKSYLHLTLGVPMDRIRVITDVKSAQNATWSRFERNNIWSELKLNPESSRLFVYVAGKGATRAGRAVFLPTDAPAGELVDVGAFMDYVGSLPAKSTHVLFETDFSTSLDGTLLQPNSLADVSRYLLSQRPGWVWFAADARQTSGAYSTADQRTDRIHGLLTYFFCRALQEEYSETSDIRTFVDRNLTFTSRRLHNRAQDSMLFGDSRIPLVDP